MNKGDAAMQISTADAITKTIPGCEVLISTPFPEIDQGFYDNYKLIICSRRRLIWASLQIIRCMLWRFFNSVGLNLSFIIPERELQEYLNSALIVDLSGDMLTEDYGPHVAYSHFIPLLISLILKRPYIACAQSIGPFKLTKFLARYLLNRASLISVRDQISFDYLINIGINPEKLKVTADMAFLLTPASQDEALELLSSEGISFNPDKKILGVSLSQLVEKKYQKFNPAAEVETLVDLMARALDEICGEYDMQVLFVPHVTGPASIKDDRIINRKVQSKMKASAHVIQGDYTPSQLKGMIKQCHCMIGARMHANIGALSSGIPTVAISYSHKTPGIMDLLGQKSLVIDIVSLDYAMIIRTIKTSIVEHVEISETLKHKIQTVKGRSAENLTLIANLLSKMDKPI
jgi:colanic acid/amylovoran biosynthesis protein